MKCSLLVLSSYLDGELEARRQGELEAHLVGCQRCRSGIGYLSEEVERVSALGRVTVAEHSMEQLLVQLGLVEAEAGPGLAEAEADDESVQMTGMPMRGGSFWEPSEHAEAAAIHVEPEPHVGLAPLAPLATPELSPLELAPSIPHAVPPAPLPATAATPPTPVRQWPPPTSDPDPAPIAPVSAGAFPPGGPEPSDLPDHATASGGDAEMTATPTWTPREAPPEPTYPMTDEDVLDEPVPVERFGPPQQSRASLFERLRDRIAVRRALSRSAADDDAVRIVSGSGAPLRSGRARMEVERRRHESMRSDTAPFGGAAMEASDPGDEVDLGPLPPTAPFVAPGNTPMPRPGQLALPGTEHHPSRQVMGTAMPARSETPPPARPDPIAPPPRPDWPMPAAHPAGVPVPPPRHSLESAIGAPPPVAPRPPIPDPLAEALSEYERGRVSPTEPRPWRPREIPEDAEAVAAASAAAEMPPPRAERSAVADRPRRTPVHAREGRRLLGLFGAATLVMLIVGVVSGKTTTPLPASTSTTPPSQASQPSQAKPQTSAPAAQAPAASVAAPQASARPQAPAPAAAGAPQLTGTKVLGDGGSGYQVSAFRYGQHPNDFRIVLDMGAAGSATGTPKAIIGFLDTTTLLVSIEGVVPAGSTGSVPPGSVATGVTLMQPSPFANAVTYQIKLAHAVTFTAGYVPGPLRLVLDLAG